MGEWLELLYNNVYNVSNLWLGVRLFIYQHGKDWTGISVRCGVVDPHNQALRAQSRTIEKIRSKPAQLRKIWHNLCIYLNKYHFPKVIWWFQVIFSPFFVEIPRKFYQLVRQKQNGAHSVERDCALVQKTKGVPSAYPGSRDFITVVFIGFCQSK